MNDEWIISAAARRILVHWADDRPAWVWSADGGTLVWRNHAARCFGAKRKKSGLRLAQQPTPIKGQVARAIRLGSTGRSSLSRMQFIADGRPVSATTIITPLEDADGGAIALVVGVDPIDAAILAEAGREDDGGTVTALLRGAPYVVTEPDGTIIEASDETNDLFAGLDGEADHTEIGGRRYEIVRFRASQQGHQLVVLFAEASAPRIDEVRREEGIAAREATDEPLPVPPPDEPQLPGFPEPAPRESVGADNTGSPAEALPDEGRLSSLFDRLAGTEALYAGLPRPVEMNDAAEPVPAGDRPPAPSAESDVPATGTATDEPVAAQIPAEAADMSTGQPAAEIHDVVSLRAPEVTDVIAAVIEFDDDLTSDEPVGLSFRVTGRGFTPIAATDTPFVTPQVDDEVERASRYNFTELGRILSDRVAGGELSTSEPAEAPEPPLETPRPPAPAATQDGALINIAGETFILNRLPLGILVFRDQQVLFANRALTDLLGHGSIDSLREAGLVSVFPADDPAEAGPVTHLIRRDGTPMPVTARLQSITWQGRPAVMLSAMSAERHATHEAVVRDFAAVLAQLRDDGFVVLDRTGTIVSLSAPASSLLGDGAKPGGTLAGLLDATSAQALRGFLEQPARFAETARPSLMLRAAGGTGILLFAEGMAGIVTGYFGLVSPERGEAKAAGTSEEPSMLVRVSRGVRRPLNTIIGFADLIRSAAFGTSENHRYLEYARDIKTAGQEIAVLVDEIDDYARLKSGTFAVRPADLDLASLLDSCIVRVRGQANAARVLVRTAISENLPHVRADRASLGQAVLNLLASAIDQTPASGSVILSAQTDDAGGIAINIRDTGAAGIDPGERFVVFRDGVGKDGEALAPVRSSVGLALTRSLIAVNACTLTVSPAGAVGTIFSVSIPAELVGPAAA